jgi:hypothetical protein
VIFEVWDPDVKEGTPGVKWSKLTNRKGRSGTKSRINLQATFRLYSYKNIKNSLFLYVQSAKVESAARK